MSSSEKGIALVTGASSGIGEVYAERLAARGYDLLLVARNVERLNALAERLRVTHGVAVETLSADLGNRAELLKLEARLRADASISLLINNAGLLANGPMAASDPDLVEAMLTVNVTATTRLAMAAAANFGAAGRGGIVNIASAMAMIDTDRTAAYGATKAYVLNLSLGLDLELRPHGVRVQAVLPGYTRTPMINSGNGIPDQYVMDVDAMVDAALSGYDQGEVVTIPSLEDLALYEAWVASRLAMQPQLSLAKPASRYTA
jgi:short-subunit dehydrogenase